MMVEGRGHVKPRPEVIKLSASDVAFIRSVSAQRNAYRGYSSRRDVWGRGFLDDPAFYGLCGEHAACSFLNRRCGCRLQIDTALRMFGDGGTDIDVFGVRIEVKTRVKGRHYLVRRLDEQKKIKPLNADLYVSSKFVSEREVHLLGWMWRRELTEFSRFEPSTRAGHWNLNIDETRLHPMSDLAGEVNLRRAA